MARSVAGPPAPASRRRPRRYGRAVLAALAVVLASLVPAVPAGSGSTLVVLQMNLCNSGMAVTSCYSFGRAVDEAVTKIHRYPPDLVTLQEVCRDDLYAGHRWGRLAQAMADLYGPAQVSVDFTPAWNRYTGRPYRCVDGAQYGVAVIHRDRAPAGGPADPGDEHRGWYRSQDGSDELRAWTCTTVVPGRLTGCTTHLSTDPDVAERECRELVGVLGSSWVLPEVVVAGDFNLTYRPGKPYDVQRCARAGYDRRGDGSLQQVFFSRDVHWVRGWTQPMRWTDHPLLYQRFRL